MTHRVFAPVMATLTRWVRTLREWFQAFSPRLPEAMIGASTPGRKLQRLRRVILHDAVYRAMFDGFERHRQSSRGEEEIGWVLLGVREEDEAVAMAALPAGVQRDASAGHVMFHGNLQAVASRIVRKENRRVGILGVVHTHPGSLRHPSSGDFRGDSLWVGQLRGREGIFGIGTADADSREEHIAQLAVNQHMRRALCYTWYTLTHGDSRYQKIPVEVILGPDLAEPLAPVWPTLERHADALERLLVQQAGVQIGVVGEGAAALLTLTFPLAEAEQSLRVLLQGGEARYYWEKSGELSAVQADGRAVDQAVYLFLAELAARNSPA